MNNIYRYGLNSPATIVKVRRMLRCGFKEARVAADCNIIVAAVRAIRREGK